MTHNPFAGTWRYRSFKDIPEPVESFETLRFAEAELELRDAGSGLLEGRLKFGEIGLQMKGSFWVADGRYVLRVQGTGEPGTATEGWVYDYTGQLNPSWPAASGQRRTIVGTIIRSADHKPDRKAGVTASFVAVSLEAPPQPYQLPEAVARHFANRLHRLHHAAWHGIRNGWPVFPPEKKAAITALHWQPPRPAKEYARVPKRPEISSGAGEDFLYFHREMVDMYRTLMRQAGVEPIIWVEIPPPGDDSAPGNDVPPAWPVPGEPAFERRLAALKTDSYYWNCMRWWDLRFKDPAYLSTLRLGELGALMEFSVHNDMHMRWSAQARDPETGQLLAMGRKSNDFGKKWDVPGYDFLGEFYSSHVNPIFWRLHGWIDDRISDWYQAHEAAHPGEVKRRKLGATDWFELGKWVQIDKPWVVPDEYGGGHGHGQHGSSHADDLLASLEKIVAILYPPDSSVLLAATDPARRWAPWLNPWF